MPYVLEHNRPVIAERLAALARYLDLPGHSDRSVTDWILALRKEVGIPHTLAEIGVDEAMIAEAAPMAVKDPSTGGNPRPMVADDYVTLYQMSLGGMI